MDVPFPESMWMLIKQLCGLSYSLEVWSIVLECLQAVTAENTSEGEALFHLGYLNGGAWDFLSGLGWLLKFCSVASCMIMMPCLAFPGCQESDPAFGNAGHVPACGALHADRRCPANLLPTVPLLWPALLWCQEGTSVGKWQAGTLQNVEAFSFLPSSFCLILHLFLRKSLCRVTFWKLLRWGGRGAAVVGLRHEGSSASCLESHENKKPGGKKIPKQMQP